MKNLLSALLVCLVACLAAAFVSGCKPSLSVVPVSGKVTVDGQPVTAGNVSYLPADKEGGAGGMSAGEIKSDGTYTIYTAGKSGAPAGKYKVTVTPSMVPTPGAKSMPSAPFNKKYEHAQETPLNKEVTANAAPGAYDLPLTK